MFTTAAPGSTKENLSADGRDELLFVPLWGQVVECFSSLDAAIIAELGKRLGNVDLGELSDEELERLIAERVPRHLEAVAEALRRRAGACRKEAAVRPTAKASVISAGWARR